jgi:hypothetical protein
MKDRVNGILAAYEGFYRSDVTAAFSRLATDVEWSATLGGPVLRGADAVREYWAGSRLSVEWCLEPDGLLQRGDRIFAVVHQRLHNAAHRAVDDRRVAHVLTFRRYEVVRVQSFDSMDEGLTALYWAESGVSASVRVPAWHLESGSFAGAPVARAPPALGLRVGHGVGRSRIVLAHSWHGVLRPDDALSRLPLVDRVRAHAGPKHKENPNTPSGRTTQASVRLLLAIWRSSCD